MHRSVFLVIILGWILSACLPSQPAFLPAETLAAQTLAARPATSTAAPTSTPLPTATFTPDPRPPTPVLDLSLPGAYCLNPDAPRTQGLVTRVLSGDTIEVATGNQTWLVHYIGLDAPNLTAPAEWQAAQSMSFNESLVGGRSVTLIRDVSDVEPDGSRWRYVVAGTSFVNYELVRQGFGALAEREPDRTCRDALIAAQVEAQNVVRGIWQPTPIPTATLPPPATITFTPGPVTPTTRPVCECSQGLTCNAFRSKSQAQACQDYCIRTGFGPILRDQNGNGLVCEGMD